MIFATSTYLISVAQAVRGSLDTCGSLSGYFCCWCSTDYVRTHLVAKYCTVSRPTFTIHWGTAMIIPVSRISSGRRLLLSLSLRSFLSPLSGASGGIKKGQYTTSYLKRVSTIKEHSWYSNHIGLRYIQTVIPTVRHN